MLPEIAYSRFRVIIYNSDGWAELPMNTEINALIKQLSDKDGRVREKARLALVDIGKVATIPLTKL